MVLNGNLLFPGNFACWNIGQRSQTWTKWLFSDLAKGTKVQLFFEIHIRELMTVFTVYIFHWHVSL